MTRIPVLTLLMLIFLPAFKAQQPTAPAAPPEAGAQSCVADFDMIEAIVGRDYAGFADKVTGREAELSVFTDRIRADVRAAIDPATCTAALRRWIGFFRDRHLDVTEKRLQATAGAKANENTKAGNTPAEEPGQPSLRFLDDSTAVLRLPDFASRYKTAIDSLIAANRARLTATPYLIVDVRGNGGGWTASYASVIPLLYTDPIFSDGVDAWASPGNIAAVRELTASDQAPEAMKAQARILLTRMEANPGKFVTMAEDSELHLDTVYPMPRAVAVLVDRRCASTCEQFVLDARQSRKVKVLGIGTTRGLLDYGNSRAAQLPSGQRQLHVPFTRSHRLPESPMDMVGIMPDVRLRKSETDAVEFAHGYLRSAGSTQSPEKRK